MRSDQYLYCIADAGTADLATLAANKPQANTSDAFSRIIGEGQQKFGGFRSGNSVGPAQLLVTFDINNDDKVSREELAESPMPKLVQFMMMQ